MNVSSIPQAIKDARMVSTPLIAVSTPDQHATEQAMIAAFNGNQPPVLRWNVVTGLEAIEGNDAGLKVIATVCPDDAPPTTEIAEALKRALLCPPRTLLFLENAHRWTQDVIAVQAIANLRQPFLSNTRTLVLLGPSFTLPPELSQDVLVLDEALPDDAGYAAIIAKAVADAQAKNDTIATPDAPVTTATVKALRGLAAFPADQVVSLSLVKHNRLASEDVWDRKLSFVAQTKGISVMPPLTDFSDIAGMDAQKQFFTDLFAGPDAPSAIVVTQEIEKLMAGVGGDNTGVTQYILKAMLDGLEDNGWTGLINVGGPGTGKTALTQALAKQFNIPAFDFDIGSMKESHVGDSEANIRAVMKMLRSIGGRSVYFVATCNGLAELKPELKRRFTDGVWYVDLPNEAERLAIWRLNLAKYFGPEVVTNLTTWLATNPLPEDEGWTGAEIRNCVRNAYRLRRTLRDAAKSVIPVSVSDSDTITNLRKAASGRWLDVSTGTEYTMRKPGQTRRAMGGE